MNDWWDTITANSGVFTDDNLFCAFPNTRNHYVDSEVRGKRLAYPQFNKSALESLQREEFQREKVDVMWYTTSAEGVRWVGSDTNRMEICYVGDGNWYFICQQGELFFSVNMVGCHPGVHCNNFCFCNSDGSSSKHLNLSRFVDPNETLNYMFGVAADFTDY